MTALFRDKVLEEMHTDDNWLMLASGNMVNELDDQMMDIDLDEVNKMIAEEFLAAMAGLTNSYTQASTRVNVIEIINRHIKPHHHLIRSLKWNMRETLFKVYFELVVPNPDKAVSSENIPILVVKNASLDQNDIKDLLESMLKTVVCYRTNLVTKLTQVLFIDHSKYKKKDKRDLMEIVDQELKQIFIENKWQIYSLEIFIKLFKYLDSLIYDRRSDHKQIMTKLNLLKLRAHLHNEPIYSLENF